MARYDVLGVDGAVQGAVVLRRGDAGWTETCRADLPGKERALVVRKTATLGRDAAGNTTYAGRHAVAKRHEEFELRGAPADALRWERTQGLRVERRTVTPKGGAEVPIVEAPMGGSGLDARCSLLSAISWVEAWRSAGSPARLVRRAMHLPRGRVVELLVERREQREVDVDGAPVDAARLFAQTPFAGFTVWVAGDRVLSVSPGVARSTVAIAGFTPPTPPPRALPDGIVEADARLPAVDVGDVLGAPLAATIARPETPGPHPVALLLHGSGPGDRDGNVPGMRIDVLRDVAHALTEAGIATIRWDKRGVAGSKRDDGRSPDGRMQALAADARRWLDFAEADPSLDARCALVVGHSEGGWLGPHIAGEDDRVAGVVMLGGAASNLRDILRVQLRLIAEAHGVDEDEIVAAERTQRGALRAIAKGGSRDLRTLGLGESSAAWLRSHFDADPAASVAALRVPTLALLFEHDLQVPASEADALRGALGSNGAHAVEVVPGLDHLLRRVSWKPGLGAYADPDRGVDAGVLRRVAEFARSVPCVGVSGPAAPPSP